MPRPSSVTLTSQTTSAAIPVNSRRSGTASIGFCVQVTGTNSHQVEHTFDDIYDPTVTPVWFTHAGYGSVKTGNYDGNYAAPIMAIRLNCTAWTNGSCKLIVLQGD